MVVDAEVVVDPEPGGADGGGVETRHLADVGEEGRVARAVTGLALDARGAGEAAPGASGHLLRRSAECIPVTERRLELQTRHNADGAALLRVAGEARGVPAVPRHRREGDARREPDLVAGAAVFGQSTERLRPLRVARGVRRAQADLEEGRGHATFLELKHEAGAVGLAVVGRA